MSKRALIAAFFALLFFLHQDFWWKNDPTLVLGFLPVSLAYHMVWTLLVAFGWFLVGKFCWPQGLDEEPEWHGRPARERHPNTGGTPVPPKAPRSP